MSFVDLEASVALEAMSPCMQKLLKTRRQNTKWASGKRQVRRKIHKAVSSAQIQDPSLVVVLHHPGAVARHKLISALPNQLCESPELRRGGQCSSPYTSRSLSPCTPRPGAESNRCMARAREEEVQIVGYLHLPLLSNVGDVPKGKRLERERIAPKMSTLLPPISCATQGDDASVTLGVARKARRQHPFVMDVTNANSHEADAESTYSYHPFKKAREVLRQELSLLRSRSEVEEECRIARLTLKSIQRLPDSKDDGGSISKCVRGLLSGHLANAAEHVRVTSLLALLDAEEQHRLSSFKTPKACSFEPTMPTAEKLHKQAPRPARGMKSSAKSTPKHSAAPGKKYTGKSHDMHPASFQHAVKTVINIQHTPKAVVKIDVSENNYRHASPSNSRSSSKEGVQSQTFAKAKSFFRTRSVSSLEKVANVTDLAKDGKDGKGAGEYGLVQRRDVEACFKKFMDDGSIHHDDIIKALETMGFLPRDSWVDEVYSKISKFTVLRWEQFDKFVKNYAARQVQAYQEAFLEFDKDCSGRIDMEELANLLETFDIEPMTYVLHEVIREVDPLNFGVLDQKKFNHVMEIVTNREGFSRAEYNSLIDAFHKFDVDASGEISKQEFTGLLLYLGLGSSLDTIAMLLRQFDRETSHDSEYHMGEREFLHCVKQARDEDLNTVKLAIEANDADDSGTLSNDELQDVFESLGYYPSQAAVADAALEVGLNVDSELDMSQFWQLLQALRSREGFCNAETADAKEMFKRYSSLDFISGPDLDVALRYMGHVIIFEEQQCLSYQVDLDMSGQLDYYEFRKLLRICRDRDITTLKQLFNADRSKTNAGLMRPSDAAGVLTQMGFHDLNGEASIITEEDIHPSRRGLEFCVNIYDLVQVMIKLSVFKRKYAREHCGFCVKEVTDYKSAFRAADDDGGGELHTGQIVSLLDALFPEMSSDTSVRQQLIQVIKDADMNGNSQLDLKDFLRLMRTCSDMQIKARFDKERCAIQETGFSPAEINEFRYVFLNADVNHDQELSFTEFKKMISSICPMGDKNTKLLSIIFNRLTNRQCQVEGRHDHADFPEFLWLWHHLLETNFGGIQQNTEKRNKKEGPQRRSARHGSMIRIDRSTT